MALKFFCWYILRYRRFLRFLRTRRFPHNSRTNVACPKFFIEKYHDLTHIL